MAVCTACRQRQQHACVQHVRKCVCDECGHLALPANDPSAQVSVARDVELFDCVGDTAGQLVAVFDPQLGEVDQLTKGWWDGSGELVFVET